MALPAVLIALVAFAAVAPPPATAQTTLRIVTYNIRHGEGMDGNVDLARIASVLRPLNADVVALQEVDRETERTGGIDQTARLAQLLGMAGFYGAHRPYQGGEYGNAIVTRLPALDVRTHALPPSAGNALAILEVRVPTGGWAVSVVSIHLAGSPEERLAQADSLSRIFAAADRPVILAGDLNARRGDRVMNALATGWQTPRKSGDPDTYPANDPDREIDFVLIRSAGRAEILEHRVIDEATASDHRPVLLELRIW